MNWTLDHRSHLLMAISGVLFLAGPQTAAAKDATACLVLDKSEAVAIVICPPGLEQAELRKAGENACLDNQLCSAWIWDDADKAPKTAPPLPTGIAKEAILSSVAIWDNTSKQLVIIDKVK